MTITASDRSALIRLASSLPKGDADLDAALGTTTVGFATLVATPLPLGEFPIDPTTGFPDTTQLLTNSGTLYDLGSGDADLSTPGFVVGQQVHFGKPGCVNLSKSARTPMRRGFKLSAEHKENIRRGKVGVVQTNAHRLANSKSHEGLTHSAQAREKMSSSHKGRSIHTETRAKISRAHQGKKMSEASRQKMSEQQKGKPKTPFSEGHKKALAVAMRKSWERRKG